VSKTYTRLYEN